jgi:monoamine oxidase
MAKTPLLRALKKALQLAHLSSRPGMPPPDEIREWLEYQQQRPAWTRRQFISGALQTGALLGVASVLPGCTGPAAPRHTPANLTPSGPRIAIIGGGMAGLHAGYILKKAGKESLFTIYEASGRTGGRMMTVKLFNNGQTTEFGGEFVDSNHKDIRDLAKEFGIAELDKKSDSLTPEAFFMDGRHHDLAAVVKAFDKIRKKLATDAGSMGEHFDTPEGKQFDTMPLSVYLNSLKTDAWFKKLLEVAYVGEYGLDADQQSAINLINTLGVQETGFEMFGESDERIKLLGGNQQICDRLADELKDNIKTGQMLAAIKNKGDGFTLSFSKGSSFTDVDADYVIMTLPFTVLKDVDGIDRLTGMTPEKIAAIRELGYGTNGKVFMGLNDRPWRQQGYQGYLYMNNLPTGWDSYHLQNNNAGPSVFTLFLGGRAGALAMPQNADLFAPDIDKAFPGFKASYDTVKIAAMNWAGNPMSRGSYACYKPGQWSTLHGQEGTTVGNMYFAGEHCSSAFQGYMNGAAETGRVAAERILERVKG